MLRQKKRITRKRERPRRKRDLGLHVAPKPESWRKISLRVRQQWWNRGNVRCGICGFRILHFMDMVPDHIEPGKMGGCKNNSETNLQPAHSWCNTKKGSIRNFKVISAHAGTS